MVRRIVWLHIAAGRGRLTVSQFEDLFRRAELPKEGSIAPPMGLTLEIVKYS
jgi:tRNA U38,U39,U40 pseudouridine synthase TruA